MRIVVLCCVLAGCTYRPGAFAYTSRTFPGQRATVGCLDISVHRRKDMDRMAVLGYEFGNRCDRPIPIDLARVAVVGRMVDGNEITLQPFDPNFEIMALRLDGRLAGGEAIAYRSPLPLLQLCVDVATISGDGPSHWMCFSSDPGVAAAGWTAAAATRPASPDETTAAAPPSDETTAAAAPPVAPTAAVAAPTDPTLLADTAEDPPNTTPRKVMR